jgi:hypothetical protein
MVCRRKFTVGLFITVLIITGAYFAWSFSITCPEATAPLIRYEHTYFEESRTVVIYHAGGDRVRKADKSLFEQLTAWTNPCDQSAHQTERIEVEHYYTNDTLKKKVTWVGHVGDPRSQFPFQRGDSITVQQVYPNESLEVKLYPVGGNGPYQFTNGSSQRVYVVNT